VDGFGRERHVVKLVKRSARAGLLSQDGSGYVAGPGSPLYSLGEVV